MCKKIFHDRQILISNLQVLNNFIFLKIYFDGEYFHSYYYYIDQLFKIQSLNYILIDILFF